MSQPTAQPLALAACIGIDWSDQRHAVCLQATGSAEQEFSEIAQEPGALQAWIARLGERFGGRPVGLILEQSKGALIYALMAYDFLVLYPINPQSLKNYRQALHLSGAKDDPTDAQLALQFLQAHRAHLRVWMPDDVLTRQLQLLAFYRRRLVGDRTRLTNRLTQRLKEQFPQALTWLGELSAAPATAFLQRWPTLADAQSARRSPLRRFWQTHYPRTPPAEIEAQLEALRQATPLTRDDAILAVARVVVPTLARLISSSTQAVAQVDHTLKTLFAAHPDQAIFASFPGAGAVLAPRLLAALGADRSRFQSAEEVQRFAGVAPVTEHSGQSHWVHRRWACSKFLLQTFFEYAHCSQRQSDWAQIYLEQQTQKGKSRAVAIRALACKWVRIIYACWRDRVPYDEARYIKALKLHHSPLARKKRQ